MLSSLLQHLLKLVDLILSWFVQGVNNKAKPTHSKRVTNSPRQSPTEICKTFAHGKQDKKTGLDVAAGVDYEIKFSHKGEKCGNSYLNYFDESEQWLEFPNYGVKVLVSESDN